MFNLPAMLVIVMVTALLVVGIRETARFNSLIVAVKLLVIFLLIGCAASAVTTANWVTGAFGWSGVVRGAAMVFFAYVGFDAVSTAAQEARKPERDMPIGVLGSLVVCAVLYVAVAFVLTGIVPFDRLNVADPIAVGIDAIGVGWLAPLIKLGIVFGLTSVILVTLLGQLRSFRAMAHDGLLPPALALFAPRPTGRLQTREALGRTLASASQCATTTSSTVSDDLAANLVGRADRFAGDLC